MGGRWKQRRGRGRIDVDGHIHGFRRSHPIQVNGQVGAGRALRTGVTWRWSVLSAALLQEGAVDVLFFRKMVGLDTEL